MKTLIAILLLLPAVLMAGCGDDDNDTTAISGSDPAQEATAPTETPQSASADDCAPAERPQRKSVELKKPAETLAPGKDHIATVKTSCGSFKIKLDVKRAPKTASSFRHLAKKRLFDRTFFHRIVSDFVIQGGDPLGNGTGDAGYKIVEEPPADLTYDRGVVAMAKGGNEAPGTSSSQFFVVTGSQGEALPPEYALLGEVVEGMDVVDKIAGFATPDQSPSRIVVIESIRVK